MDLSPPASSASGSPRRDHAGATPAISGAVAVLLDWENLKGCLHREGDDAAKLKALLTTARHYGPLAVARAYADWGEQSRLGVDAASLLRHAIEPIYTIGGGLKNSADIRLAVDAVALCERSPEITTFIIGSGDGGLISVVNYLRLRGRKVIVIAVGASLSGYLRDAADLILRYEEVIEPTLAQATPVIDKPPPSPPSQAPPLPAIVTPQAPPPNWEEIADWVIAILRAQGPGPYPFTTLAHQLKERHGFTATLVAMKFRRCMERIAETHPLRITCTPLPDSTSPTMSYFVELIVAAKVTGVNPLVTAISAAPNAPSMKRAEAKKATPASGSNTPPPEAASPIIPTCNPPYSITSAAN